MKKIILVDLGENRKENNEPIGIECIATYVESNSEYKVDIQWLNIDDDFQNLVNYDIIGISLNIGNLDVFDRIYKVISERIVVVGGNIPTFAYEELLQQYSDIICSIGEGEETFLRLIEFLEVNTITPELETVPNIAFKLEDQKFKSDRKPFDINSAPDLKRNREIITAIKETNGIVRIEASRGCSWRHCSFCCVNSKYADPRWRGFSIDKITRELVELSNLGILSPYFTDEDFYGSNPNRVVELAESIIDLKQKGQINNKMDFFLSILTNDIATSEGREALIALKKAGLREVFMGIESIGQEQLKRYNKKAAPDDNKRAINFVKSLDVQVDLGFILFDPEMSIGELALNIKYIEELHINISDSRSLKRLRIQPKTSYAKKYIDSSFALDINNIEYPYVFIDKKVDKVYRLYKEWEEENLNRVWRYQALTRGENVLNRENLKQSLGRIRAVDFEALKLILFYVKENNSDNNYVSSLNELRTKKETLMHVFESQLSKGDL